MMRYTCAIFLCLLAAGCNHIRKSAHSAVTNVYECYDCEGMEVMPEAPYDVRDYIAHNLRYPADAREQFIEGRVNVRFYINERGYFDSIGVAKPLYPSIDSEAVRLITEMPQPWKPAQLQHKPVGMFYILPILFRAE